MNISQDPKSASMPDTRALAAHIAAGSFIVNLCALPGSAVPQPPPTAVEELRCFVSRRNKDGTERFYLHVGFFQTREESEQWLDTVRATYPNAFVSRLAATPRSLAPDAPPIDDTQMLRVLEARAPRRDDENSDTGSYAVQSETRVLGTPPDTSAVAPPMHPPVAQATPDKPPAKPDVQKAAPAPADAWNAFVASNDNDSGRTSGVRHLRVEILRPRKPGMKPSKTRRP